MLVKDVNSNSSENYPKVNYIGNKKNISSWICDNMPSDVSSVLDIFSGGGSVSYELKRRKYRVIANDSLYSAYVIGKALIENKNEVLSEKKIDEALKISVKKAEKGSLMWLANNLFFSEEIEELAKLVKYSNKLKGNEKYIFLALLRRAMIRKLPYSRMNLSWENIVKLRDEEYSYEKYKRRRAYHNKSFSYHMRRDLSSYNAAVFDNSMDNFATQKDVFKIIDKIENIDLVYMDPPYPGTMNNYAGFYGAFDKIFNKDINFTDLTKGNNFLGVLEDLVEKCASKAKYLMISINGNTNPSYEEVVDMCRFYGEVTLKGKKHNYQISGKDNKNKNIEYLIIVKFYK